MANPFPTIETAEPLPPIDNTHYEPQDLTRLYMADEDSYDKIIDILGAWPIPFY